MKSTVVTMNKRFLYERLHDSKKAEAFVKAGNVLQTRDEYFGSRKMLYAMILLATLRIYDKRNWTLYSCEIYTQALTQLNTDSSTCLVMYVLVHVDDITQGHSSDSLFRITPQ